MHFWKPNVAAWGGIKQQTWLELATLRHMNCIISLWWQLPKDESRGRASLLLLLCGNDTQKLGWIPFSGIE